MYLDCVQMARESSLFFVVPDMNGLKSKPRVVSTLTPSIVIESQSMWWPTLHAWSAKGETLVFPHCTALLFSVILVSKLLPVSPTYDASQCLHFYLVYHIELAPQRYNIFCSGAAAALAGPALAGPLFTRRSKLLHVIRDIR